MTIWNGLTSGGAVVPIQVDDQGRVVAVGNGPDSPLVVDGDYLRPRDTTKGLGTASIDLDASGGAASFADGKFVVLSTGQFTFLPEATAGKVATTWAAGVDNSTSIIGNDKDNKETWRIKADGTATLQGRNVPTEQTGIFSIKDSGAGTTFSPNSGGTWTRTGSMVSVTLRAQVQASGSSSAVVGLDMPYENSSLGGASSAVTGTVMWWNIAFGEDRQPVAFIGGGTSKLAIFACSDVGTPWTEMTGSRWDVDSYVYITISFRTDDETWVPLTGSVSTGTRSFPPNRGPFPMP